MPDPSCVIDIDIHLLTIDHWVWYAIQISEEFLAEGQSNEVSILVELEQPQIEPENLSPKRP
jgi:hypothetical protein